ncbi:MAG: glycoside hydrolase family 92 protein, partial [Muribaculaceae bacterium]|nr:glycoside hydrolase family 92 protein [Muribaculaceae bacterium]
YVFACMGLYPQIPGIGGFAINTPVFESVKIHLKNGDLVINGGSEKNIYINKMLFNGQPYESTWIDWADVSNGAVIDYTVSSKPNVSWGTKIAPPSYK